MPFSSIQETIYSRSASPDERLLAAAFEMLWRAYRYALGAGLDAWDFAVEIREFHRSQISNSELRWLLVQGYARHAAEIASSDGKRRFRDASPATLGDDSCFVIAEAGLSLISSWNATSTTRNATTQAVRLFDEPVDGVAAVIPEVAPFWDAQRRKLWFNGKIVKHYHCQAPSQYSILDAFQSANWPAHVADPLPLQPGQCPKRRLHDAVKRLNRGHFSAAIRFRGDGSGRGVLWEPLS